MKATTKGLLVVALAMAQWLAVSNAWAGDDAVKRYSFKLSERVTQERPTLAQPMKMGLTIDRDERFTPVFTRDGRVFATTPKDLYGLSKHPDDDIRNVVYDTSSDTWFAWVNGMIVEVRPDGSLPVTISDPPGHDFDIRAAAGVAIFRDPDKNEIVTVGLAVQPDGSRERRVLRRGEEFYNPKLSPSGDQFVLSVYTGGKDTRLEVANTFTGKGRDLGIGYQPTWAPDGNRIFFMDFENDTVVLTASKLFVRDMKRDITTKVFESRNVIVTNPVISRDGKNMAFFDEVARDLSIAELPVEEREVK